MVISVEKGAEFSLLNLSDAQKIAQSLLDASSETIMLWQPQGEIIYLKEQL